MWILAERIGAVTEKAAVDVMLEYQLQWSSGNGVRRCEQPYRYSGQPINGGIMAGSKLTTQSRSYSTSPKFISAGTIIDVSTQQCWS